MIDLDPKAWRAISAKCKIKDNGLDKALSTYEKLADDAHDECLKAVGVITQLVNSLRKAKEVSAAPEAGKYLAGLASAADHEKSEVTKAKAAAAKAQAEADKAQIVADKAKLAADKAKAAADKAEAESKEADDEADDSDDKQEGGLKALMISMLQRVKTARPDAPYQYLLCEAKPFPFVVIAKQINASHRKLLEKVSGGSKRFLKPAAVTFEDGHYCFESDKNIPGAARRVQGFLKNLTGKKFPVMFGTMKAGEEEESTGEQGEQTGAETAGAAEGARRGATSAGAEAEAAGAGAAPVGAAAAEAAGAGAGAAAGAAEPALNMKAPFSISASVGQGGKNKPADVQAVQTALNLKLKAGLTVDGKCDAKTIAAIRAFQQRLGKFKPDGLVEVGRGTARALAGSAMPGPAPEPPKPAAPPKLGKGTLDTAADAWKETLSFLEHNFGEVKKAVRAEYASEHPTLIQDIENNLKKLDGILEHLGSDLADTLAEARSAKDPAQRKSKLLAAKAKVVQHITYVKAEPLIAHIDNNPWVTVNCRKGLTDCLMHVAQGIGNLS